MDTFGACREINDLLSAGKEIEARNGLIRLLAELDGDVGDGYAPLINRLVRDVGLYPYLDVKQAGWQERYVYEAFKADVGSRDPQTLHREQSRLLSALLAGRNIAVSAPTSFGKSFIIDAYIAARNPSCVVILVPTIALADETRRRMQRKFGNQYRIITTADDQLRERNILIFPQERAFSYVGRLGSIDILIVDEFYKASKNFDKDRAPALVRSIIELGKLAKQRYFLAPNISQLKSTPLTSGMEFMKLDFNTVFLERRDLFQGIGDDEEKKDAELLKILASNDGKSLIYAGTYSNVRQVANLLIRERPEMGRGLLKDFKSWLSKHYEFNWELTQLVARGAGIHNGQLHRSLSQIQIRLFEEEGGLDQLVSTSSIIEGVNTSAKNVILWSNRNGKLKLNDFTYKNIIGRGGRMFRHFIGRVFVLEEPPPHEEAQLELEYPEELLGFMRDDAEAGYTREQIEKKSAYETEMKGLVGSDSLEYFRESGALQNSNTNVALAIARDIHKNPKSWNGLGYMNSSDPEDWVRLLYKIIQLQPSAWEIQWGKYVAFVKILSANWYRSIPDLLKQLDAHDIGIDEFFKLERNTTFRLASLLGDVETIYNRIHPNSPVELGSAIGRFAHAFLPKVVYQLEEYGLPRMLSRKLCRDGLIDLEKFEDIHAATAGLSRLGLDGLLRRAEFDAFDRYILGYFFEGLEHEKSDRVPSSN